MLIRPLIAVLLLVFVVEASAQSGRRGVAPSAAISCLLTNGDRITGQTLSVSSDVIAISTAYAGTVTIRTTMISRCETEDEAVRAQLTAAKVALLARSETTDKTPSPQPSPQSTPSPISKDRQRFGWKRTLAFNYTLSRGNADISDLNVSGNFVRTYEDGRFIIGGLLRRGIKNGKDFAGLFTSNVRYERRLDMSSMPQRHLSFFAEAGYERDEMRRLDNRFVWNGGLLIPLLKSEAQEVAIDLGGGVTHEEYETGLRRTLGEGVLRFTSEQKVLGSARFRQQISAFPDFAEMGRYRFHVDLSLRAPLTKALSLRIGALNRFDNRPQEQNVKRNDFSLMSGLAVEF
ncbi:MAG: hypothetical protein C4334_04850 [Pyrinomonas sp.]|uniref:DUF481 domain-containing protein n=1 Tax=Pyrinomonas sp. TaxID=2080306 RepID=UPI0033313590